MLVGAAPVGPGGSAPIWFAVVILVIVLVQIGRALLQVRRQRHDSASGEVKSPDRKRWLAYGAQLCLALAILAYAVSTS